MPGGRGGGKALSAAQVRFGTETLYLDPLLRPPALRTRAALWSAWTGLRVPAGATGKAATIDISARTDDALTDADWTLMGYRLAGVHAFRADRYERLLASLRKRARGAGIAPDAALAQQAGCSPDDLPSVLKALGCVPVKGGDGRKFRIRNNSASAARGPKRPGKGRKDKAAGAGKKASAEPPNPESPFAALKGLIPAP